MEEKEIFLIVSILKIAVSLLVLCPALKFYKKQKKILVGPIIVEIPLLVNLIIGIMLICEIIYGNDVLYMMQKISYLEWLIIEIYGIFSYIKYMRETNIPTRVVYMLILVVLIPLLEMVTTYIYNSSINIPN